MVTIRLARAGAKKKPFYRVVVADSRFKRDGRFIEQLGTYDPRVAAHAFKVKYDRVEHWINHGAQPSETVGELLARHKGAQPKAEA